MAGGEQKVLAGSTNSAGFQSSGADSKRDRRGSRSGRKESGGSTEATKYSREEGASRERGSGGASGVMAGSGGSASGAAAGAAMSETSSTKDKGKRGSSFRKVRGGDRVGVKRVGLGAWGLVSAEGVGIRTYECSVQKFNERVVFILVTKTVFIF